MMTREERRAFFWRIVQDVTTRPGHLSPATRQAIHAAARSGATVPGSIGDLAAKTQARAADISDDDVRAVKNTGASEDEIFEATVSAALGASAYRLDVALKAMGKK